MCRDGIKKAKAQMELNLMRYVKNNKKGFLFHWAEETGEVECTPSNK